MLTIQDLSEPPASFLNDEVEGGAFHLAFQKSGIREFTCGYLAVHRHGERIAVVPYFITDFHLNTMLDEGIAKRLLSWLKLRIACVGHPSTDLGLMDGEPSAEVLELVNQTLARKAALVAYKGFGDHLPLSGFVRARGLPVPRLKIVGDYYSALPSYRRNDFKRKLKRSQSLRFEEHDGLAENLIAPVFQLYLNTYNAAKMRFEKLTPDYFRETGSISKFLLVYEKDELIGFAQLLCCNRHMTHKYVGMDYEKSRQHSLYFLLFLRAIDICVREQYLDLEFGVSSYHFKKLLGSEMIETSVYYRHKLSLINWILAKLRFLLEPTEEELR